MLERMIRRQRFLRLTVAWLVVALAAGNCGLLFALEVPAASDLAPLTCWWLFFVSLFVLLVIRTGWRITLNPEKHPFLKRLVPFGDPWKIVRKIDAEIASGKTVSWIRAKWAWRSWPVPEFVLLTAHWLVQVGGGGVTVVYIPDIVWLFKRTRSLIAGWGSQRIILGIRIYCEDGGSDYVSCSNERRQDEILDQLLRRVPEILAGFETNWRQIHRDDSDRLAEIVEDRFHDWERLSDVERTSWHAEQMQRLASGVQHLCLGELDPFSPVERRFRARRGGASEEVPAGPALRHWAIGRTELSLDRVIRQERVRVAAASAFVLFELIALGIGTCISLTDSRPWVTEIVEPMMLCGGFYPGLITLWLIWRFGFRRFTRGLCGQLAEFGSPREIVAQIDADLRDAAHIWLVGRWSHGVVSTQPNCLALTRNWLLRLGPNRSAVIHLPDLCWVWKRVVHRFSLGAGPQDQFQLGLGLRSGQKRFMAMASEAEAERALEELLQRIPALMTGWQGKWLDVMEQGPRGIERAFRERQVEYERLGPAEREAWLDESWDQAQQAVHFVDPSATRSGGNL